MKEDLYDDLLNEKEEKTDFDIKHIRHIVYIGNKLEIHMPAKN